MITGAVLPAFNNPLKLAGEIGMLDGISGGRLEVGFARAFLPHEFTAFGISLDESRRRFTEGLKQITALLRDENVSSQGEFHSFANVTSLPRPTQKPRPPFWIAATTTPETFEFAGKNGCKLMGIPLEPEKMRNLLGIYRDAWRSAGHPGNGEGYLTPLGGFAIAPGLDLSLTTNALKLRTMAPALRDAGLRRVNISLDTLVRERFHAIARRDRLHDVLDGIAAAREAGFAPILDRFRVTVIVLSAIVSAPHPRQPPSGGRCTPSACPSARRSRRRCRDAWRLRQDAAGPAGP